MIKKSKNSHAESVPEGAWVTTIRDKFAGAVLIFFLLTTTCEARLFKTFYDWENVVGFGFDSSTKYYLDINGGFGSAQLSGFSTDIGGDMQPALWQWSFGATTGLLFSDILLIGASTQFSIYGQHSDINPGIGNLGGYRWNYFAPSASLVRLPFILKLDGDFIGDFILSKRTAEGAIMSYGAPMGFRATLLTLLPPFRKMIYIGLQYESISFSREINSIFGTRNLDTPVVTWKAGAVLTVIF